MEENIQRTSNLSEPGADRIQREKRVRIAAELFGEGDTRGEDA